MVAGVPLIGTNCIGLREVLKSTHSVMVPIRDSKSIANALLNEMKNPSKKQAISFSKEAAFRFNVKRQALDLENIILKLINFQN
jgi:glycosyltransferase involved in cell wall biosynthesis